MTMERNFLYSLRRHYNCEVEAMAASQLAELEEMTGRRNKPRENLLTAPEATPLEAENDRLSIVSGAILLYDDFSSQRHSFDLRNNFSRQRRQLLPIQQTVDSIARLCCRPIGMIQFSSRAEPGQANTNGRSARLADFIPSREMRLSPQR